MSAAILNLNIEKGIDYSISMILQRANGEYVDLSDTGVCVKSEIVEFYDCPTLVSFTITELLPSGIRMSLDEGETSILPYDGAYYDVVLNTNGDTERLVMGAISTSPQATTKTSCP